MPSLYTLRRVAAKFEFKRDEQSIRDRVHTILEKEQVNPTFYNKAIIKKLCEFYRFDLRAILNYLQLILQKSNLTKETFLSELKNDLGEQTSYFDVMERVLLNRKSNNFWSSKIDDFQAYSKLRLSCEGRWTSRLKDLHYSYFVEKKGNLGSNPYNTEGYQRASGWKLDYASRME